ncbi:MAG: ketose-bisphosphate aldolase [Candidatus Moraniibacteriota bacterium]|nr:MAG: ketose-bisphosphate aldolase [Candidatus Moranbacteria bacterium]
MIISAKKILTEAQKSGYAVGAFNTVNLETTWAILEAAAEKRSPVIIQMTEKTFQYGGGHAMYHLVKNIADFYFPDIPLAIHLDHGRNVAVVREALAIGFKSVMMDASTLPYEENMESTAAIVREAHVKGATVQGELGNVPYKGEIADIEHMDWDRYMTNPAQADAYVRTTAVDTLAIGIGNAHGSFPERPEPDFDRLAAIRERINLPLVLHGASDWEGEKVDRVIRLGVACFNVETATKTAFIQTLRQTLPTNDAVDIRKILMPAREAFREAVKAKMDLFGSSGRA